VTIYAQGFTSQSQALMDGQPLGTEVTSSSSLTAQLNLSVGYPAATHQFSVQTGGVTSNSLPFTVYEPHSEPQPPTSPNSLFRKILPASH